MQLKIFAGSASQELTKDICNELQTKPGEIYLHMFPSGEHYCQYMENIRGCDVFLVQSTCNPAHARLMELLVMIDAAKRASAGRITVVCPYFGYLRQDRKTKSRTPITARLVADLITTAGANRIVGMDFHCDQAQGFFNIPVDHLCATPVFVKHLRETSELFNHVVVSPDAGGIKRAAAFAEILGVDFAFISKKRINDTTVKSYGLVGDVKGKNALIIDDMTESCGTLIESAKVLIANGANTARAIVTHALLNADAYKKLDTQHALGTVITTNTVVQQQKYAGFHVLSVAPLFATAINHINNNKSITELFEIKGL